MRKNNGVQPSFIRGSQTPSAPVPPAETIVATATPHGGALALLRLSGPRALEISLAFLRPKRGAAKTKDQQLPPRLATLCEAAVHGRLMDEVVAVYFPGPASATGEDVVEISCHGSPYITKELLRAALSAGARLAQPGEFTQRAFLNGRMDLAQAEAVAGLIRARNEAAHRAALSQLQGGLSQALADIREPILDALVRIEANLDHPEEDIPSLQDSELEEALTAPISRLAQLAGTFERGRLAVDGARICLAGRPNAGKSSLLNALLGLERAIVRPEPGTTRDTIEEEALIAGLPSVLIDTAGLREEEARDPAEAAGMERTRAALRACDLVLLVIDGSRPQTQEDERVHQSVLQSAAQEGRPVLSVVNKADLMPRSAAAPQAPQETPQAELKISALRKEGLDELGRLMAEWLLRGRQNAEPGQVVITSLRHKEALVSAERELEDALETPRRWPKTWEDRAAAHLRQALRELGAITGEAAPDEVLAQIFSRFCVGK